MIDEYPILAVAAAFASGRSIMHDLGGAAGQGKRSARGDHRGLRACGVDAREEGDSLIVEGSAGRRRAAAASRPITITASR